MKPKTLYANCVNLSGLYAPKPMKVVQGVGGCWWDRSGDFSVQKVGLDARSDCYLFASVSKREVRLWTDGAKAVMALLLRFGAS